MSNIIVLYIIIDYLTYSYLISCKTIRIIFEKSYTSPKSSGFIIFNPDP